MVENSKMRKKILKKLIVIFLEICFKCLGKYRYLLLESFKYRRMYDTILLMRLKNVNSIAVRILWLKTRSPLSGKNTGPHYSLLRKKDNNINYATYYIFAH
jgi:hypothetical protein